MGAEGPPTPVGGEGAAGAPAAPSNPVDGGDYDVAVREATALIANATRDDAGRIKDDTVRWRLGDLMVQLWPRRDGTPEEASAIQAGITRFANDVGYKHSMLKDFFYVAEQWPPECRVAGKSFAQHSKLRGRADKAWALLGLDPRPEEDTAPLEGLTQAQIRKVEKVLKAVDALDGESSKVLDAVVTRLKPRTRSKAKAIVRALRKREKEVQRQAEALRKARSQMAVLFDYQSFLLATAARVHALAELVSDLATQQERDYVRTVLEGTIFVTQKALDEVLDAMDERAPEHAGAIDVDEIERARMVLEALAKAG